MDFTVVHSVFITDCKMLCQRTIHSASYSPTTQDETGALRWENRDEVVLFLLFESNCSSSLLIIRGGSQLCIVVAQYLCRSV